MRVTYLAGLARPLIKSERVEGGEPGVAEAMIEQDIQAWRNIGRTVNTVLNGHYFLPALIAIGGGLVSIAETGMAFNSTH